MTFEVGGRIQPEDIDAASSYGETIVFNEVLNSQRTSDGTTTSVRDEYITHTLTVVNGIITNHIVSAIKYTPWVTAAYASCFNCSLSC